MPSFVAACSPFRACALLRPALRLLGFLLVSSAFSLAWMGRALGREVGQVVLHGGGALWGLGASHRAGGVQRLWLNGAELFLQSGTVNAPLERVLDEAHSACAVQGVAAPERLRQLLSLDGVVDERNSREGTVACFEGEGVFDFAVLSTRLQQAAKSGRLGSLGRLRLVHARRESEERTAVLSVWSEGELDVPDMFPARGDAPGSDDPELPRPPAARRGLSAIHDQVALPLVAYRSELTLDELQAQYAVLLEQRGFTVDRPPAPAVGSAREAVLWTVRSAAPLRFVAFVRSQEGTWVVSAPLP